MATTVRHAEAALELRRFAIGMLTAGAPVEPVAAATSRDAWGLFLKVEQCAAALREGLARAGTPGAGDAILDQWVRDDTQRSLSTRGQLAIISGASKAANKGYTKVRRTSR